MNKLREMYTDYEVEIIDRKTNGAIKCGARDKGREEKKLGKKKDRYIDR